ncbi:MAG: hypothetical protein JNL82_22045 [Myxococcales bacterium]|nr:hypothetical protein [Myxococcales bacterium]
MSTRSARRLTVGEHTFVWTMRWSYDRDGERVVSVSVCFSDGERRRGHPLLVRFLSRRPEYPAPTCAALPGDARAALDLGRAAGWTGKRPHWLLPACGLERPDLVVSTPTRLREWARARPLFVAYLHQRGLGRPLADALAVPAVPESAGSSELQWRDERYYILNDRFGGSPAVYATTVEDLSVAIRTTHRVATRVGVAIRGLPATVRGPGDDQVPAHDVLPVTHWASVPGATRVPGARQPDAVWLIDTAEGPRIEAYVHGRDGAVRLWTTMHDGETLERRFA